MANMGQGDQPGETAFSPRRRNRHHFRRGGTPRRGPRGLRRSNASPAPTATPARATARVSGSTGVRAEPPADASDEFRAIPPRRRVRRQPSTSIRRTAHGRRGQPAGQSWDSGSAARTSTARPPPRPGRRARSTGHAQPAGEYKRRDRQRIRRLQRPWWLRHPVGERVRGRLSQRNEAGSASGYDPARSAAATTLRPRQWLHRPPRPGCRHRPAESLWRGRTPRGRPVRPANPYGTAAPRSRPVRSGEPRMAPPPLAEAGPATTRPVRTGPRARPRPRQPVRHTERLRRHQLRLRRERRVRWCVP